MNKARVEESPLNIESVKEKEFQGETVQQPPKDKALSMNKNESGKLKTQSSKKKEEEIQKEEAIWGKSKNKSKMKSRNSNKDEDLHEKQPPSIEKNIDKLNSSHHSKPLTILNQ